MIPAVAYYRTSSAANVGADKDSVTRQEEACASFAAGKYSIISSAYDAAVSGADAIHERDGFMSLLNFCKQNGVRVILVENASRFARDLYVQMTGHEMLKREGIDLVPVDAPDHFVNPTPTGVLIQQILGAVSQFEKAMVVSKLKHSRDAMRARTGRCEGRKPPPTVVRDMARKYHREAVATGNPWSLRIIAEHLAANGHFSPSGKTYSPSSVQAMLRDHTMGA